MVKKKVIVLGLDGATWDFIIPLIKRGELNTFKNLLTQSIATPLRSTIPPTTIPAWQSMFSGLTPEKLGITDFFKIKDNKLVPVTSKDFKGKILWDVYPNLKYIIYNIPGTYPAYEINGILITDPIGKWSSKSIYPSELKEELERIFNKKLLKNLTNEPITKRGRVKQLYDLTKAETKLFIHLYENYKFDIFIFRYEITDYIAHWAKNKEEIESAYKLLDKELEKILSKIDLTDSYLLIVSDHGVQPQICNRRFFINSWLLNQGCLKLNYDIKRSRYDKFIEKIIGFLVTHGLVDRITLARIYRKIKSLKLKQKKMSFTQAFMEKIDIVNSKAFAYNTSAGGITCVQINESSSLSELQKKLIDIKDKDGIQVITKVLVRSIDNRIELVVESHQTYILNHEITNNIFLYNLKSFKHSDMGVMILHPIKSKGTDQGYIKRSEVNIYDIMPIICYLLDLPIPEQIDGKVPIELFREYSKFTNKQPKYVKDMLKDLKLKKVIMRLKSEGKI